MLNIQLVSIETIKPSSPTPDNLRHLQLSLLDQLAPVIHVPVTLFYSGTETTGISCRLKKSLSEVLTRFYPLAGRIREDDNGYIHIECNDEGVEFYETRVDCAISEFLRDPSMEELKQLTPRSVPTNVPLVVQLNVFECGGLAIGAAGSHKIIDGASGVMFHTCWAGATRRGGDFLKQVAPVFGFSSLFPPRTMKRQMHRVSTTPQKVVTLKFLFETPMIAQLRENAKQQSAGFSPTSVEAVSALIWRCAMRARGETGRERKPVAVLSVDIRARMEPWLPRFSFGNLYIPAFAIGDRKIGDCVRDGMGGLERLFRGSVQKITVEYVREVLENGVEMGLISGSSWDLVPEDWENRGFDFCLFSSWLKFPYNEMDFGWGEPVWSCFGGIPERNTVVLMSTGNGGIESWVMMVEEEMCRFRTDPELLAFASANPRNCWKEKVALVEARL